MDWVSGLQGINLLWTAVVTALAGLGGAYAIGSALSTRRFTERLDTLKSENERLSAENEQTRLDLDFTQLQLGATSPGAPSFPLIAVDTARNMWLREVSTTLPPASKPILVIANLKGGVAKTMLAANLAAYFSMRGRYPATSELKNKNVLLVDLDYQGSLSGMILDAMDPTPMNQHPNRWAQALFSEQPAHDVLSWRVSPAANLPRLSLYPAEYGFDDFEAREAQAWLAEPSRDIRFALGRTLRSQTFAEAFDLTIIDTGPRITLGAVAALAAATHLLIPTAPDHRSREAASRFLRRVTELRAARVCPELQLVGVAPTLVTSHNEDLLAPAAATFGGVVSRPELAWARPARGRPVMLPSVLPFSYPIQNAAEVSIPYLEARQIRIIVNAIGAEVESRITNAD
jgi:chromosome partitioning protein